MVDLHTHILPGIDDGSRNVEMSLELLRRERAQGVDTVVLTPHFYRRREHLSDFLERRRRACDTLLEAIEAHPAEEFPRLYLGAEVAWAPDMTEWEEISRLCIGGSEYLLLEMPFSPWGGQTIRLVYDLMRRRGITPIIAHLERFLDQPSGYIEEILSMGVPIQLSAEPVLHRMKRRPLLKLLRSGQAQFLASDTHNLESRVPNLGEAMQIVERKLGQDTAQFMDRQARRILQQAKPLTL